MRTYDSQKMGQRRWRAEVWLDDGNNPYARLIAGGEFTGNPAAERFAMAWVARHQDLATGDRRVWGELVGGEYVDASFASPQYGPIEDAVWVPFLYGAADWRNGYVEIDWNAP